MGLEGELTLLSKACNKEQDAIEFRVPSDPKILKIVRLSISHLCELAGFSEDERNGTTLAVDEACSNIIRHAYDGANDKPIIVSCSLLPNGIQIVICDFGKNIHKSEIKSRDLDEIRPGGLGVHLIQSVMDVVNYERIARKGNKLTLAKYVKVK
ncbi:ATP-binding protein [candidate division KSB1 bacterium]|nr:ATP-binding protein [candidate division KSB1 bacterium]